MKKVQVVLLCMLIFSVLLTAGFGCWFYFSTLAELGNGSAMHFAFLPWLFHGRVWTAARYYYAFL